MSTSDPRIPARFDRDPWEEDLARATHAGRTAAEAARDGYEPSGIPRSHLKPCDEEGRDGTSLPQCFKVYLPRPNGRFGMVFTIDKKANELTLMLLAFGVRHHPPESNTPTVYQTAHQRLHA
jgi:hypothetical protein